jgi:hypothetical protein
VALDSLFAEIVRREKVCPNGYPYSVTALEGSQSVEFDRTAHKMTYAFLLLLSVSLAFRSKRKWMMAVERAFDEIAHEALREYMGPSSSGLRFGAPRSGTRPGSFAHAIPWLCEQLGLPRGTGKVRRHTGDGGVDIVVWRPFREHDRRMAFVTILAQCTVEMAWHNKGGDIKLDRWRGWVDFGVDPVTCLAVPFAVADDYDQWDEIRRTSVLVLDRLRLADLRPDPSPELAVTIRPWVANEMERLGAQAAVIDRAPGLPPSQS